MTVTTAPAGLRAQTAGAAAHVRFWKTELRELPVLSVSLKPATGRRPAAHEIGGGGPGYVFENYVDAPAGREVVEVVTGANKHLLTSATGDFTAGGFFTVLLHDPEKAGGALELEIIEDSAAGTDPGSAQITVRNFVTNLTNVKVTVGDGIDAQFPSGKGFMQMNGLKFAVYPVNTIGIGPDGKPFEWSTEVDFRQHHHQTLLIYPDPYGRIRPRLCVDGENVVSVNDKRN